VSTKYGTHGSQLVKTIKNIYNRNYELNCWLWTCNRWLNWKKKCNPYTQKPIRNIYIQLNTIKQILNSIIVIRKFEKSNDLYSKTKDLGEEKTAAVNNSLKIIN